MNGILKLADISAVFVADTEFTVIHTKRVRICVISVHHNGTIRTFRVVLFILVRICCTTSQYSGTIRTRTIRTSRYNGTIRTKPIRKIPRTVVPGICFVRVIVKDFDFVFVDNDFLDQSMDLRIEKYRQDFLRASADFT